MSHLNNETHTTIKMRAQVMQSTVQTVVFPDSLCSRPGLFPVQLLPCLTPLHSVQVTLFGTVWCYYMLYVPQVPLFPADVQMVMLEKASLSHPPPKSPSDLGSSEATGAFDYRDKKLGLRINQ